MTKKEQKIVISKWKSYFEEVGIEHHLVLAYLEYVENLVKKDVPPIFDFFHLCRLIGVQTSFAASVLNSPSHFYREFEIPKRSGGKRKITAPYPSLKFIQSWIYDNILARAKVHGCAHGFVCHKSILTNAYVHQNQKCLLKIDLKDFFPSIPFNWVIKVFKDMGYENQVAYYLASFCCLDGSLPQGSPASPIISNIIALHMDRRLYRLAKKFNMKYSRYADDIAFSGEDISVSFVEYVIKIIEDCGLVVNEKKIRLYREHGNKILTGVSLATGVPKLPRSYRRSLEKELYYINKYGLSGHIQHSRIRKDNYLESILGKVGYWLMIEPNNNFAQTMHDKLFREYRRKLGM